MGNCFKKDKSTSITEDEEGDKQNGKQLSKKLQYNEFQTLRYGIELDMVIGSLYWKVFLSNRFWSNI